MVLCPTLSVKAISLLAHALLLLVRVDPPGCVVVGRGSQDTAGVGLYPYFLQLTKCGFTPPPSLSIRCA